MEGRESLLLSNRLKQSLFAHGTRHQVSPLFNRQLPFQRPPTLKAPAETILNADTIPDEECYPCYDDPYYGRKDVHVGLDSFPG